MDHESADTKLINVHVRVTIPKPNQAPLALKNTQADTQVTETGSSSAQPQSSSGAVLQNDGASFSSLRSGQACTSKAVPGPSSRIQCASGSSVKENEITPVANLEGNQTVTPVISPPSTHSKSSAESSLKDVGISKVATDGISLEQSGCLCLTDPTCANKLEAVDVSNAVGVFNSDTCEIGNMDHVHSATDFAPNEILEEPVNSGVVSVTTFTSISKPSLQLLSTSTMSGDQDASGELSVKGEANSTKDADEAETSSADRELQSPSSNLEAVATDVSVVHRGPSKWPTPLSSTPPPATRSDVQTASTHISTLSRSTSTLQFPALQQKAVTACAVGVAVALFLVVMRRLAIMMHGM